MEKGKVQNFFRRSKFYLKMFEGESINVDEYFEQIWSAFNEKLVKTISLRLLDRVAFPESLIDFGKFQIQRFSKDELDNLVENQLNHIFYPYAELNTFKLSHYWFIKEESYENKERVNFNIIDVGVNLEISYVSRTFPDRVIQLLALFDWKADQGQPSDNIKEDMGWLGFSIPVSIRITDDILESPRPSPDLSNLEFFPIYNSYGEEAGEGPQFYINIEEDELKKLKDIVEASQKFLEQIDLKERNWEFFNIAMGYLAKAFFTEGLEQLLWHITVLEALLGEKGEGVTERLARRIASILGESEVKRKALKKQFKELYDFRCNLVHGNQFQRQAYVGHLRGARSLARRALLWFLHYLNEIQAGFPKENSPTREEILMLLDLKQKTRARLAQFINSLPAGFPYVCKWVE